jgi:hypothetical protein
LYEEFLSLNVEEEDQLKLKFFGLIDFPSLTLRVKKASFSLTFLLDDFLFT